MRKTLLGIAPLLLLASEPSAFDAGNLSLENPYGLTQSEEHIVQNTRAIKDHESKIDAMQLQINSLTRQVEEQKKQIEGMLSVVDGSTRNMHDRLVSLREQIEDITTDNKAMLEAFGNFQKRLEKLEKTQAGDAKRFLSAADELTEVINEINREYVDRERFRKLESAFFELEESVASADSVDLGDDNWAIYVDMQEYLAKQEYDEVEIRARHLIQSSYKRAAANYHLGEAHYARGNYEDAVFYFKESWSIYDRSEFMPVLLLHSAKSLENMGNTSEANLFYESLIDSYPDSPEAEIAKQNI